MVFPFHLKNKRHSTLLVQTPIIPYLYELSTIRQYYHSQIKSLQEYIDRMHQDDMIELQSYAQQLNNIWVDTMVKYPPSQGVMDQPNEPSFKKITQFSISKDHLEVSLEHDPVPSISDTIRPIIINCRNIHILGNDQLTKDIEENIPKCMSNRTTINQVHEQIKHIYDLQLKELQSVVEQLKLKWEHDNLSQSPVWYWTGTTYEHTTIIHFSLVGTHLVLDLQYEYPRSLSQNNNAIRVYDTDVGCVEIHPI